MTRVNAPFTDEQVIELNAYQSQSLMHPFTCPNHHEDRILVAYDGGWGCPTCDYSQTWAHDWMIDGSWRESAEKLTALLTQYQERRS